MKARRHFLAGLGTAAMATWTQKLQSAPDPKKDVLIGHASHRRDKQVVCQCVLTDVHRVGEVPSA